MNQNTLEGNWEIIKGQIQKNWGKLTNDDLDVIDGQRKVLAGRLQKRYGYLSEKAEEEIDSFLKSCDCKDSKHKHQLSSYCLRRVIPETIKGKIESNGYKMLVLI